MPRGSGLIKYIREKQKLYARAKRRAKRLDLPIKGLWRSPLYVIKHASKKFRKTGYTIKQLDKFYEQKDFQKFFNLYLEQDVKYNKEKIKSILRTLQVKKLILKINNNYITINENNINNLTDLINNKYFERTNNQSYSDEFLKIALNEITNISIIKYKNTKKYNKSGLFFPYYNNSGYDLSKYQIYSEKDYDNKKINLEHCLFYTLKTQNINKKQLINLTSKYDKKSYIRKKDLYKIAEILNININLYTYDAKKNQERKQKINVNSDDNYIHIGLYEGHYFLHEKVKNNEVGRGKSKTISSLRLIHNLKNHYKPINHTKHENVFNLMSNYSNFKNSLDLNNIIISNKKIIKEAINNANEEEERDINLQIKRIIKEGKEDIKIKTNKTKEIKKYEYPVFYADCETFVYDGEHRLYLLGYVGEEDDNVTIDNVIDKPINAVIEDFFKYITKNANNQVIVYFHNLKYDFNILFKHFNIIKTTEKDNQYYSITIKYLNYTILIKDSYKLLSMKLSDFNGNFNLPYGKKEAIAYEYYTEENHNKVVNKNFYKIYLKEDEKEILDNEIKTDTFNPYEYYKEYLKYDCLTLKHGLKKFREIIFSDVDSRLDIHGFLTISSLTDRYMKINNAFKGVIPVQGVLRNYISQAIRGGRVAVNEKYKNKVIEEKISDFDGVSLYPSAIHRLCEETGLALGYATRFKKKNLKKWNVKDYCILTIKIIKVNKKQQIPFISYKNKDGILEYVNTPSDDTLILDKYTLEDYINFHQIEYEIIDGVYWNKGFNKTMGKLINKLFNVRLKNKKSNPALANVLKLMLNSAYGKTIMKQNFDKKIYLNTSNKQQLNNYIYNNYETIKKINFLNERNVEITTSTYDDSTNYGHVGCSILSYSKRIMNEVFDIANDNKIIFYYTDTDSIHMNYNDMEKLSLEYKNKYKKELVGKYLGQFHNDFQMDGAVDSIYAIKSLFLGKKSYIDILESKNEMGEKINGYHFRLKGITEEGILYESEKKFNGNIFEFYKELSQTDGYKILLNPEKKVMFEYNDGVRTRGRVYRTVCFKE